MPFSKYWCLCLVLLGWLCTTTVHADERPNMILFIADDMGWRDCGAYGHPHIQTPNLDQLAKDGMRFDSAFLTCSSCSPSRASIITGRYPHNTTAQRLHWPLPGDQITFVELLTAGGYYTAAAGKWHLGNATKPKFSHVTTRMNQWVETLRDRPQDKPFFLWFAFSDPHRPYRPDTIANPHQPEDVVVPPYLPDTVTVRKDLAMYYDEITRLDGVVGKVREELQRQQIADNTLILFISDNGMPFPRAKTTVFDSGIKTPWIVAWPAKVKAGTTCDQLVSSVDIAPTIIELAKLRVRPTFQGKNFAPLLSKPDEPIRDYIFAEHNWHDFDDHGRAVRSKRFKLIRNYYTDLPNTPPADAVRSPTYAQMLQMKEAGQLKDYQMQCFTIPRPMEALYDLEADPYELKNVASDPKYAEPLQELKAALDAWEQRTDDRVPEERTPDAFDRVTGKRVPGVELPPR